MTEGEQALIPVVEIEPERAKPAQTYVDPAPSIKDLGESSKVKKVSEQSLLTLITVCRSQRDSGTSTA